jgi:uncharacterized protein (TIGR03437 family)
MPFPAISQTVKVTVGGQPANILYAGAAPLLPGGVDQINVQIPNGLQPGAAPIVVTIGNSTATRNVTVAIH